jgi:predicted regulator of Ras-like GTPase activity (Roadblock/LC7/MglB family)
MSDELQAFALKNTINEIKSACPDVSHAFIFTEDGLLLAADDDTDEQTATRAINALNALSKRADTIGGLESAAFYDTSNQMDVFHVNDSYLVVVGSEEAEEKTSADLARILVPAVLRLTEKIHDFCQENVTVEKPEFDHEPALDVDEAGTDLEAEEVIVEAEPLEEPSETEEPQPLLPEPPVTQFMVENLSGLSMFSDIVRIESGVIQQWKDLYGERKINEVDVETLDGQTTRCKFKPIKDSKHNGKGTIQLPQKIQKTLQTSKGELVTVKPVIGQ